MDEGTLVASLLLALLVMVAGFLEEGWWVELVVVSGRESTPSILLLLSLQERFSIIMSKIAKPYHQYFLSTFNPKSFPSL